MTGSAPEPSPAAREAPDAAGSAGPLTYDALVLAGGRARRLGGVSKPDVVVSGRRLLAHVLDAAVAGPGGRPRRTVVVAPESVVVPAGVLRTLEDPPDGGPVAGVAAGLAALGDGPAPWVLVLACDVPRAARAVPHLVAACSGAGAVSGALLVDADGRDQPLVGLYRRAELDRALTALAASRDAGTVRGASVRALLAPLTLTRVPDDSSAAADVDTWEDVRAFDAAPAPGADVAAPAGARTPPRRWDDDGGPPDRPADPAPAPAPSAPPAPRSTRPPEVPMTASDDTGVTVPATPLDSWVRALAAELGVDPEVVDVAGLLDVARDAAHGVARPATPLTTFLLGYAVATGTVGLDEAMRRTSALAAGWQERTGALGSAEA